MIRHVDIFKVFLWGPNFLSWPNFLVELAEKSRRDRATLNPSLQCLYLCLRARYIDNTVRLVSTGSDVQFSSVHQDSECIFNQLIEVCPT